MLFLKKYISNIYLDSDSYLAQKRKTVPGGPDTPCIRPVPPALDRPVRCFGAVSQCYASGPGMRAGRFVRTRSNDSTHSLHTAELKTQPTGEKRDQDQHVFD